MVTPHRRLGGFGRDRRGAVLVEFSLVLLMLLILVFGIIDFGLGLYAANSLNTAARAGARFAAVLQDPASNTAAIQDTVMSHVTPFGGVHVQRSDITVTVNYGGVPSTPQSTTVQVKYWYDPITPITKLVGIDSVTLRASARFRAEFGT